MGNAGLPRLYCVDPTVDLEATFNVQHLIQPLSKDMIIMICQVACVPGPPSPDLPQPVLHDLSHSCKEWNDENAG